MDGVELTYALQIIRNSESHVGSFARLVVTNVASYEASQLVCRLVLVHHYNHAYSLAARLRDILTPGGSWEIEYGDLSDVALAFFELAYSLPAKELLDQLQKQFRSI